jgi:hypothetical protein
MSLHSLTMSQSVQAPRKKTRRNLQPEATKPPQKAMTVTSEGCNKARQRADKHDPRT